MVLCKCIAVRQLPAGEMVNKETGEVVTYGIRTECKLWLPGEEYPSDYTLRGDHQIGKGTVEVDLRLKKEQFRVTVSNFKIVA